MEGNGINKVVSFYNVKFKCNAKTIELCLDKMALKFIKDDKQIHNSLKIFIYVVITDIANYWF